MIGGQLCCHLTPALLHTSTSCLGNCRPRNAEHSPGSKLAAAHASPRRRTEEGYAVYSEEELGLLKKGGNTDLCPFDCDCCF